MERRLRVLFEGAIYHVNIRGIELRRWFGSSVAVLLLILEVTGTLCLGTGAAVSNQIQCLLERMAEDAGLRARVNDRAAN